MLKVRDNTELDGWYGHISKISKIQSDFYGYHDLEVANSSRSSLKLRCVFVRSRPSALILTRDWLNWRILEWRIFTSLERGSPAIFTFVRAEVLSIRTRPFV